MTYNDNNMLITGFAQLPKGTTLFEQNSIMAVALIINHEEKVIEDAEFTFVTDLSNYYLSSLIKGMSIKHGMDSVYERIRKHCQIPSQGAVIQALRSAWDRYQELEDI